MALKTKLITAIISFCLVLALISVGVWAVQSASVTLGGSVTFTATDVYCDVTGQIENMDGSAPTLSKLSWANGVKPNDASFATWQSNPLAFDKNGTAITFTITIKNNSSERYIKASFTDTAVATNGLGKAIMFDGTAYTSGSEVQIPVNQAKSFVITFSLTNGLDNSITDAPYSYSMSLVDENA